MMMFMTFGIAIVSALCPLVNLEVYMAGVGAFRESVGIWPFAAVAAMGQTLGKLFWVQVGRSSMNWGFVHRKTQSVTWKKQFDRVKLHTENRPWLGAGLVFGSATVGLPPLAIMAVLMGQLHYNRVFFLATTMIGRTLRFAVVLGGVTWLMAR